MNFYTHIKTTKSSRNYILYTYLCIVSATFILSACSDVSSGTSKIEIELLYKTPYTHENAQKVLQRTDLTYDYLFSVYGINIDTITEARITVGDTVYDWNTDPSLSKITLSSFQTNNVGVLGVGFAENAGVDYEALPNTVNIGVLVNTSAAQQPYTKSMTVSKVTYVTKDATQYTPIYTWWSIQSIQNDLSGNYILQNDIQFPKPGTYGFPPYGFIPLGYDTPDENVESTHFTGNFVGDNHAIENLFIDTNHADWPTTVSKEYIGLFGTVGGNVKHVMLKSPTITTSRTAGGIAGQITNNLIIASVVGGSITGGLKVGGLVGNAASGKVIGYSTSTVSLSIPADLRNASNTSFQVGGLVAIGTSVAGYATGDLSIIDPHHSDGELTNLLFINGMASAYDCGAALIGYAVSKVSSIEDANNTIAGLTSQVGATVADSSGYWDMSITSMLNANTIESIIGISATKNIVFDNGYKDSAGTADTTDDIALFTPKIFTDVFDTTSGKSKTWPQLKSSLTFRGQNYEFTLPQPTVSDTNDDGVIEITFAKDTVN